MQAFPVNGRKFIDEEAQEEDGDEKKDEEAKQEKKVELY